MDFTRYPDKPYQLNWLRYYLQCKAEQNGGCADDVTERDVEECYVKTNKFALVSFGSQVNIVEIKCPERTVLQTIIAVCFLNHE